MEVLKPSIPGEGGSPDGKIAMSLVKNGNQTTSFAILGKAPETLPSSSSVSSKPHRDVFGLIDIRNISTIAAREVGLFQTPSLSGVLPTGTVD